MSPRKGAYPQFFVTAETKFTALSSHSPYYLQGTGYKLAIIAAIMLGHGCPNKRERREREREREREKFIDNREVTEGR